MWIHIHAKLFRMNETQKKNEKQATLTFITCQQQQRQFVCANAKRHATA